MGLCISVKKESDDAGKSRSVKSIGSNFDKHSIQLPVRENSGTVNAGNRSVDDVVLHSLQSSGRFTAEGSKEESFYDSQPWMESDAEDDYFSVKGDFTPSCASTPVHLSFSQTKPSLPVEGAIGSTQASSPPQGQKLQARLLDLFYNENEARTKVGGNAIPRLGNESKSGSGGSSFSYSWCSDNKAQRVEEAESPKSALRCLPRHSSSGRRKRMNLVKKQSSG